MKNIKIITLLLVVIGAFNWGLIGIFNFDLVATIFGDMSIFSRLIYSLVGISSIFVLFDFKNISK